MSDTNLGTQGFGSVGAAETAGLKMRFSKMVIVISNIRALYNFEDEKSTLLNQNPGS